MHGNLYPLRPADRSPSSRDKGSYWSECMWQWVRWRSWEWMLVGDWSVRHLDFCFLRKLTTEDGERGCPPSLPSPAPAVRGAAIGPVMKKTWRGKKTTGIKTVKSSRCGTNFIFTAWFVTTVTALQNPRYEVCVYSELGDIKVTDLLASATSSRTLNIKVWFNGSHFLLINFRQLRDVKDLMV